MSHAAQGSCDCPLASKFCDLSALRRQAWFHAIRSQDMEAMDKFVKLMGGSIPREYFIVIDDKEGHSALHMAARQNLGKSMAHLLEMLNERTFKQGILDMQQESTKTTPLIEACKSGHLSMVKLLCEVGAKWYLPCGMGMQPRKYAEINDRLDIVAYFNENSASSNLEAGLNMDQSTLIAEEVDNLADFEAPAVDTGPKAEDGAEGEDGAEVGEASAVQATPILLPTPKAIDAEAANMVASQQHKGSTGSITSLESEPQTPLPLLSPHEAEEVMRVLCNCSFFPSMDAPSLKELSRLCCHIQLLPGETLAKNPDEADAMYIIVKGKIIVEIEQLERLHVRPERQWSIRHRLKKRRYKRRLTEYDCFGENIILIGEKMHIKIEAEEQTEMLALSVRSFNRFLMHRPSLKPDLASFLAGQTKNADAADDYDESELALEMEKRIHEFHKLPDEDEEFEEQKPSRVRAIVEIPLAEPAAKYGLNLAHCVLSAQGQEWLKYSRNAPILHGDLLPRASKDDDTGCLSYLRACEELCIRPRNAILLQLTSNPLRFDSMSLTTKEGCAIAAALAENKFARAIDLSCNRLFNEAFVGIFEYGMEGRKKFRGKGLFEAVMHNNAGAQYDEINLKQTLLGKCSSFASQQERSETITMLGDLIDRNTLKSLTTLKLGSNFLGCAGAISISEAVTRNRGSCSLTFLDLSNNGIANNGAKALAKMIECNDSLLELDLSWNHILESGSETFIQGLVDNQTLTTLHFGWNRLGERGGRSLGRLFDYNKTLLRIDLQNCGIVNTACDAIAEGLRDNKSLKVVKFQWNPLGSGCTAILDAVLSSPGKPNCSLENCGYDSQKDGRKCAVDPRNLTRSYKFNLSDDQDRKSLQLLYELALKECGQNWRNERINGRRFHFPEEGLWPIPDKGVLEFDFVDLEPVNEEEEAMDADNFLSLMSQMSRIIASDGRLKILEQASFTYTFNYGQGIQIISSLPREVEKEQAFVHLFSRILQRAQRLPMILLRCFKRPEICNLQRRLGPGKVFDAYRPAGPYILTLSKAEDRAVLHRLKKMKDEGKFNGCDCSFSFSRGLLRGFNGSVLNESVDVEELDLNALAAESRAWAKVDFQPLDFESSKVTRADSAQQDENVPEEDWKHRLYTVQFEFTIHDMKKTDMKAVFQSIFAKGKEQASSIPKLPPIESAIPPKEEEEAQVQTVSRSKKKRTSPSKKKTVNEGFFLGMTQDEESEEENIDKKSIFPIPRSNSELEALEEAKQFTSQTQHRRMTASDKANKMIDQTSVRSKHGTALKALGLKWIEAGSEKPTKGTEIKNDLLAAVLHCAGLGSGLVQKEVEFKKEEWEKFQVAHLSSDSYIKVGFRYFKAAEAPAGMKLRGGPKKWYPWAPFTRSHTQDYDLRTIGKLETVHGNSGGAMRTVVQGELGEASCINYMVDLSLQVINHTIPRMIYFSLGPRPPKESHRFTEIAMYANLSGLPCADNYIWEGQKTSDGDRVIVVRPNDPNYIAGIYYITLITESQACDFELVVQGLTFQSQPLTNLWEILNELDTDMDGQPLPGKHRHVDCRVALVSVFFMYSYAGVKELRERTESLDRVFLDITHKSSKRVLKGSIGSIIPPKPKMRFRPVEGMDMLTRGEESAGSNFDTDKPQDGGLRPVSDTDMESAFKKKNWTGKANDALLKPKPRLKPNSGATRYSTAEGPKDSVRNERSGAKTSHEQYRMN